MGERPDGTLESHQDEVWYRLSLDTSEKWKKIKLTREAQAVGIISDEKYDLYREPLPLPRKKVLDLAKFRAWIPREFHALYPPAPPPGESDSVAGAQDDEAGARDEEALEDSELEQSAEAGC